MTEHNHESPEFLVAPPSPEELQEARTNLLDIRETFGIAYDSLPAPDRLIRLLDRAIELIPGEGTPTEEPYDAME